MLTKTHPPTAWPPIAAVLSKKRHALVGLALLFIAPPLHADTFTTCRDVTQIPQAQCNTLVALYDNTAGDNWTNNTGWKQTDTPCSWYGVTCSGSEVSQISLSSNQLTGPIPSLNTLASLQTLEISGNQLCQDSNANYAGWTEVDEFPSCGNPNITLTSPAHGATSIPISGHVFTWEPDAVASAHRIVISTQTDFANFTDTGSGGYCNDTTTCLTAAAEGMQNYTALNLSENTTYYWKVRASRNPTFWSEVHSFTTGAAPKTGCNGDTQLPDNLCEGLVAYYPMSGNANDGSGNGHDGIVNGATLTTDQHGNADGAYSLDGKTDRIKLNHKAMNGLASYSIGFWTKTTQTGSSNHLVSASSAGQHNEFLIRQDAGKITILIKGAEHKFDTPTINDGVWHLVNLVRSSSTVQVFIDGSLVDTWLTAPISDLEVGLSGFWLGGDQDCLGGCWDENQQYGGVIDDLLIHNRAFTASEIQSYYNSTKPATTGCNGDIQLPDNLCEGLTAYYPMNGNANDGSVNGLHGTEFGNPTYVDGVVGQALKLTEADDYIGIDKRITLQDDFTTSFWVKLDKKAGSHNMFMNGANSSEYNVFNFSWRGTLEATVNGPIQNSTGQFDLLNDRWNFIVYRNEDSVINCYVNNELFHSYDVSKVSSNIVIDYLVIGKDQDCLGGCFDSKQSLFGAIDEVTIHNRALTETEIQTLYNAAPVTSDETVLEDAEDGDTENWSIYYGTDKEGGAAFANVFDEDRKSQVIDFKGNPDSAYRFIKPDGSPLSTENFIARWSMKITETGIGNPHINKTFWKVKTNGPVSYLEYRSGLPLGCNNNGNEHYAVCGLGYELRDSQWHNITRDLKADLKAAAPDLELLSVEHVQFNMVGRVDDIQLLNRNDVNFHTISGTITNNGQGVSGKSLSNTGADCQPSDNNGDFTCTVPEGWYGSLTPENTNEHYFAPLTRAYSEVSEDITGQDFTVRLIEDGLEDAEDGDTDGWSISANPTGDSAFANVFDSEKNSRVMEFTGHSRSSYQFVFPDGTPLSTTNFIARWDVNMATGFGTVFWRVETTGSVIYMEYRMNTPLGCHLSSKSTYAICGVGENMQENTWYTITRDIKADLKTIAPDIELQSVEYMLVHTAGRVDNIQLLESLPTETVLEDAEDGNTENWSIYSKEDEWTAAFTNVFDSDKNSQVIEFTGNYQAGYQLSFDNSTNFIARWSLKTTTNSRYVIYWRVKTSGPVIYLSYRSDTPLGCHFTDNSTYVTCGLDASMHHKTWHTITRDLEADLKSIAPHLELQEVEHLKVRMAGRIDDIQLLNRNDVNFHTISGTITNNGQGVSSKSLSNTGADCQASDSHGNFTCTVPEGWYGSLTPENTNEHYFAPLSRTYSEVSEDITGQNFTVRLIEDGLFEDAEDGDTQGWGIYDDIKGDAAFANVVENENNRVIEFTGHSSSGYLFAFPKPFSTTRFIAQWRMKMTSTDWQQVYWRVKTSGSIVYLQYNTNRPEGCQQAGTYIICGLGENMPANQWYTITRDLKADLKAVKPELELLEVEYLQIRMAGQIDDIKLLKEMPAIDCNTVTEIPTAQCETLVALYDSTGGDNWTNHEGWKTTDTPCSWHGVSCENGVVTAIDLDDNNLTGTLPDWSALTRLQELLLGHNKITETIPELSSLTNLKVLSLKYNDLTGTIPELSHLSQLTTLWLEGNNLTGSIPDFSGLTSLTGIHLSANQLSGEIPDLSGLTSAHSIYLGDNQLTGSIPDLSRVTNLWNFSVANNQLSGEIPSLASLPKLESFDLTGDNNKLCRNTEADYAGRPEVDAFPLCGTQAPEAVIAVSEPQEQSDGLAVSFDASGSTDSDPDGNITSQIWITSDGQIATGVNPTITFSEPGEHTVTLIITDNTGKTTSVRQTITVAKPLEIFSLTLTKQGTGKGEFHSTAPDTAIDCDIDCQRAKNDYNSDIVVTLQATPAAGSIFTSWSNGCGGTSNPTTVPINRQRYCTATFDLDPAQQQLHRFRIAKIGDGSGRITVKQGRDVITQCSSADCEAKYFPSGTELTLTTNIANDATFVGWSEDCHGTEPSITVTIEHATKCTAELALRPPEPIERRLTVTTVQETVSPSQGTITSNGIECGNGSDDCVENYPHGQQIWLKATPAPHSYFKEWTTDCSGTGTRTTLIMDTDKTCTAIFGSDSDTNANDMVKTFQDEGQLSNGKQLTDTYPPFNNDYRLQEAYRLAENVMTKIEEHIVLTGSWPHQLHGIEWYYPLPSYLYTKSIQVVSGGTNVKQANGIEEYVEGDYLKVEVLLITETGNEEIMPILISPNQEPPESSSTMRRRGHGYCWWWYRPWWLRWRW